jgi:hypothetical protein
MANGTDQLSLSEKTERYAQWLASNQSIKGTADWEIVAEEYKKLRSQGQDGETDVAGLAGAVTRNLGPLAAGAAGGAALGAPLAGVGAVPGAIAGAGAVGLSQLVGDPLIGAVNSAFGTSIKTPTEAWKELFDRAGIAEPDSAAERLVGSIAGAAGAAGGLASAGRALSQAAGPVVSRVGQTLAAQPAQQIVSAAGGGAAGQLAEEAGVGPAGQVAAALAGGVASGGLARAAGTRITPRSAQVQQTIDDIAEAERSGRRVLTSDAIQPQTFSGRTAQTVGERIPLAGTGGLRRTQQTQRVDAIKDAAKSFGADDSDELLSAVSKDLVKTRGETVKRFNDLKVEVIERLGESKQAVPVPKALKKIDDEIARLSESGTEATGDVVAELQKFKAILSDKNLRALELNRKILGESFKKSDLSHVQDVGEAAVRRIYKPLIEDMGDFIKANGQPKDFNKWKAANRKLKDLVDELQDNAFKNVLKKSDVNPESVKRMLFSQEPSKIRRLSANLSREGRKKAQAAVMSKAVDDATKFDELSPEKFMSQIQKLSKSTGIFFRGKDAERLRGLERYLKLTQRAGVAGANPPTGAQLSLPVGGAILADLAGGAGAGLASGATAGLLFRAYESAPVRNMLLRMSRVKVGSKEEAALFRRMVIALRELQEAN